jgi:AcrR family transcriptional regulator
MPLTRDRIARAALELADRDGVEALSMRRLASELGSGTMSLYGHFRDKRELLDSVMATATAEMSVAPPSGDWRDRVRWLVNSTVELFERHPSVVQIWARQPVLGAGSLNAVEAGLDVLRRAGFGAEESVRAFRLLVTYTYGFGLFNQARGDEEAREQVLAGLQGLPEDQFPNLREAAEPFAAAIGGREVFNYGLERILDGLEASLAGAPR